MTTYRIIVGVDGSAGSERALRWAARDASIRGGTVQAVMTYDWPATEAALLAGLGAEGERSRAQDMANKVVDGIHQEFPEVPIAVEVLPGSAVRMLATAAQDADLLVVGSRGHGHFRQAVLGSVSEGCIRHAPCPVVVVPTPRHRPAQVNAAMVRTQSQ